MQRNRDKTYCEIIDYMEELSSQINNMYDICPEVFLRFNQNHKIEGKVPLMYRISDMYIELDIPHNYTLADRIMIIGMLIHEYCHYIDSLTMSGRERANNGIKYVNNQNHRRLDERRTWTATKRLAKELDLWNKPLYNAICECYHTTVLQF